MWAANRLTATSSCATRIERARKARPLPSQLALRSPSKEARVACGRARPGLRRDARRGIGREGATASTSYSRDDPFDPAEPPDRPGQGRVRRPVRIVLVRHAESLGNIDEGVYRTTPDNLVPITAKGKEQARRAGQQIKDLVGDGEVYFYVSPYVRTLQTLLEVSRPFSRRQMIGVREEPRIREQDFGNFQDAKMPLSKMRRMAFGRFFYRFPEGESAADVYDRVNGFRETLRSDLHGNSDCPPRFRSEDDGNSDAPGQPLDITIVIVTHGLTLRVFLMRWYKWSVQEFEKLRNPMNCEPVIMEQGTGGRFSLSVHHSDDNLASLGLSEHMIDDQHWQKEAAPGELNRDWPTSGPSYFDQLEERIEQRIARGDKIRCSLEQTDVSMQRDGSSRDPPDRSYRDQPYPSW